MRLYIDRYDQDETGYTDGPCVQVSDDDGVFQTYTPDEYDRFRNLSGVDALDAWARVRADFFGNQGKSPRFVVAGNGDTEDRG